MDIRGKPRKPLKTVWLDSHTLSQAKGRLFVINIPMIWNFLISSKNANELVVFPYSDYLFLIDLESSFSTSLVWFELANKDDVFDLETTVALESAVRKISFIAVAVPAQFSASIELAVFPHSSINNLIAWFQDAETVLYRWNTNCNGLNWRNCVRLFLCMLLLELRSFCHFYLVFIEF